MSDTKHITEQRWSARREVNPDTIGMKHDRVEIVGEDGSTVAMLARSDEGSDLLIAGYIVGLQNTHIRGKPRNPPERDPRDHDERCVPTRMYSVWHCHPDCLVGRTNAEQTP